MGVNKVCLSLDPRETTMEGGAMRELVLVIGMTLAMMLPTSAFGVTQEADEKVTLADFVLDSDLAMEGRLTDLSRVEQYDCSQLRILRNGVYARHGFAFGDDWVLAQFAPNTAYERDESVNSDTVEQLMSPNDHAVVAAVLAAEESRQCAAYWQDHLGQVRKDIDDPVSDCEREAGRLEEREWHVVALFESVQSEVPYLVFEANPLALMDWVASGEKLEVEWLKVFTYEELHLVLNGIYARHGYTFEDEVVTAFYANHMASYQPCEHVNMGNIDKVLVNVDKLNILRLQRAAREAGYEKLVLDL